MSVSYPKKPQQILIRVTDRDIEGGLAGTVQAQEDMTLADLLSNYIMRLGFETTCASGIIVQLLTNGKVRVDFSRVVERLELLNMNDRVTSPQAMALFEDFMASLRSPDDGKKGKTMRIVVQKPRG